MFDIAVHYKYPVWFSVSNINKNAKSMCIEKKTNFLPSSTPGARLLLWINFNPNIDKYIYHKCWMK